MLKTSVALLTYNGEQFILQQLTSLYEQTCAIDQVVIYDDCSSDNTVEIVEKFIHDKKLSWKLYQQSSNVGYIKNYESALESCLNEITFLCDQDDIWDQQKVEKMLAKFEADPRISCLNTSFEYIDEAGAKIGIKDRGNNYGMMKARIAPGEIRKISYQEVFWHNISMGCTIAFREEVKMLYLERSRNIAPHDWEINAIAVILEGLYFWNEQLIKYRIHLNNVSGNDKVGGKGLSKRYENAITMLEFGKSIVDYQDLLSKELLEECIGVAAVNVARERLLSGGGIRNWIYLMKNIKEYHKAVSYTGMIVDLFKR